MNQHQDMSRHLGRTQATAMKRLGMLAEKGHVVNLTGDKTHATATITRADGTHNHITFTPAGLTPLDRASSAYNRHPQSVLMAHAIHAICDWSQEQDEASPPKKCLGCARTEEVTACFNHASNAYDWYCPSCFYGEAA